MKQNFKKILTTALIFAITVSSNISCAYANDALTLKQPNEGTRQEGITRASDYIVAYSGTLTKYGSNSIRFSSKLSVSDAGCKIVADIYQNGYFYDSLEKKSRAEDMSYTDTIRVPKGSYYVKFTYYAIVDDMVVESRTKITPSVTV